MAVCGLSPLWRSFAISLQEVAKRLAVGKRKGGIVVKTMNCKAADVARSKNLVRQNRPNG